MVQSIFATALEQLVILLEQLLRAIALSMPLTVVMGIMSELDNYTQMINLDT